MARPSSAVVRALDHLSPEDAARELGTQPWYVRQVRAKVATRGRPAGSGAEIRVRLPPVVDARLRALATRQGTTPAEALASLAASALKSV